MKLSYVMNQGTQELSQDNLNTQKWNPEPQRQNIFTAKCKIHRFCVIITKSKLVTYFITSLNNVIMWLQNYDKTKILWFWTQAWQ